MPRVKRGIFSRLGFQARSPLQCKAERSVKSLHGVFCNLFGFHKLVFLYQNIYLLKAALFSSLVFILSQGEADTTPPVGLLR